MVPLKPNPTTGFLESVANSDRTQNRDRGFTSAKKTAFLEITAKHIADNNRFPPVYEICKALGVDVTSFEGHVQSDPVFAKAWHEVKAGLRYVYTSKLADKADTKNGIIANLAILKFLESGTFLDRGNNSRDSHFPAKTRHVVEYIDAEAPEPPQLSANSGENQAIKPDNPPDIKQADDNQRV